MTGPDERASSGLSSTIESQLQTAIRDRYVLGALLGEGGMATVFRAQDLRHDRPVALKVLKPELGVLLGAERFLSEIRVTANLQHPHLLPLFDSGEADGLLYYVMPLVEGESLRARLDRERQLPVAEAVRIATAVLGALDYAHRHGVIHRDLKPENILLHDGEPLVADFGIALAVTRAGGERFTQTGMSLGTPQYMSPEQASAERTIDGRSDIYALGAVLYEMLSGEPPHTGHTMQAIIARVMTETPRALRSARASIPEHVAEATERALAKLPADRFDTAQQFAAALTAGPVDVVSGARMASRAPGVTHRRTSPAL
ncbi:MAG: serine/threonine protein kinase, partial [Gemmatimonadota bacterium]|nr:serine/threonine protein kinase [Gemmatimonadota bacterium]